MSIVRIFLFRAGVVRATVPVQLYARGADLVHPGDGSAESGRPEHHDRTGYAQYCRPK